MQAGKNWKTFYLCPYCAVCRTKEVISFRYFTDDMPAKIMFAAKAGWRYANGRWYCTEHWSDNDVA